VRTRGDAADVAIYTEAIRKQLKIYQKELGIGEEQLLSMKHRILIDCIALGASVDEATARTNRAII
jgi:hypothetical protein